MNEDKIEIWGSWVGVDSRSDCLELKVDIKLNGQKVLWDFVDVHSLALYHLNHKPYKEATCSNFEPFSCSCGVAGCAGVYDGIYVKQRKHSVEWRASKRDGYAFLGKSFFSFDKKQYLKTFNDFLFWLSMQSDYDYKLCVDLGYFDGDETTIEMFFDWLDKIEKRVNK